MTGTFGYFGKIPAAGDFVKSGLSPEFIRTWDEWLQRLLVTGREALGGGWQEIYFTAPIWRFALAPGICGPKAAAGIVMPSVDRVGRQFPLTIAAEFEAASALEAYRRIELHYATLEDTALAMLEDDATLETLTMRLDPLALIDIAPLPLTGRCGNAVIAAQSGSGLSDIAAAALLSGHAQPTLWLAYLGETERLMVAEGLPEGQAEAVALLDHKGDHWPVTGTEGSGTAEIAEATTGDALSEILGDAT